MENFQDKVREVHDIECPACGKKPSFTITGSSSYDTIHPCGHKELDKLIEERENDILTDKPPILIKPFAGCGKPTLTIKHSKD